MSSAKTMLEACRNALRIPQSVTQYDDEINDLIGAARTTLRAGGVSAAMAKNDADSSIRVAICTYVKANFGMDNPDHERLTLSFETQLTQLAHSSEYMEQS